MAPSTRWFVNGKGTLGWLVAEVGADGMRGVAVVPNDADARAIVKAHADEKRFGDALTWIERNAPDGVQLVARALSEVG